MTKMTKKHTISVKFEKKMLFEGLILGKKKGQKIRAWVDPPPLFGQCPKENVFSC